MVTVRDVMTSPPITCGRETVLQEVAWLMIAHDCGMLPVVDEGDRPIGVITDRDITCRTVALGMNPLERCVRDAMTAPCITIGPNEGLVRCAELLERHRIRRAVVVDESGRCIGVVAQADVARNAPSEKTAELVREVSRPNARAHA